MGIIDQAKNAVTGDQIEEISDNVLDKAAEVAKKTLGEDKAEQIDMVRDALDDKIGE